MDNRQETGGGDSAGAVPTPHSPAPNAAAADAPHGPDEGPALSVTATVLAAGGLVRGVSTTPAPDHFVPLAGDENERGAIAPYPPFKPLKPKSSDGGRPKHGILEEPATLGGGGGGSSSKWGVEELLGSKAAGRNNRKGFAASAKSTIVSGLGKLTAVAAKSVAAGDDDGMVEQPCEYVAMSTPCESPVKMATGTTGSDSFPPPTSSSTAAATAFKASASSRAGLAARLGSALQSWTSASGRDRGGGGGASGSAAAPREGRPGPLGAKYTQQQRSESPEPEVPRARRQEADRSADRSQPDPSAYHQLSDGQPPANPAVQQHGSEDGEDALGVGNEEDGFTGDAGSFVTGTRLSGAAAQQKGEDEGPEEHEHEHEEEEEEEEEKEGLEEETCAVPDMMELEPGNSKAEGEDLIRLEAAARGGGEDTEEAPDATPPPRPPPVSSRSSAAQASAEQGQQQQQQVDGGAEAGAGTAASAVPEEEKESIAHVEKEGGGTRGQGNGQGKETENETDDENEGDNENGNETENETESESGGGGSRGRGSDDASKKSRKRVVGLWELKAERSRLEHALAEAEIERDIERARAREAADRVEEAVERLERLRRQQRFGMLGRGAGAAAVGIIA